MDRRFLTVLGVSLVFALVVSSIFYQMTARAGGGTKKENTDTVDMVVRGAATAPRRDDQAGRCEGQQGSQGNSSPRAHSSRWRK